MRAATLVVLAATLCVLLCLVSEADAHKKHLNKKARGLIVPMRKHRAQHHRVGIRATRDNMDKFAQMLVNDLDTYSVEVNIGTPPQKFLLNLDTGSNDLLVYAPTCPKENCPGAAYDQRASRSFTDVTCTASGVQGNGMRCNCSSSHCNYHAAYGDASFADGSVSRDRIIVGDLNQYSVETFFGQIVAAGGSTLESAAFYTNATLSGILGLAPTGAGSAYNLRSPILELADQHDLPVGFTLCLRPHVGGALVIGEDYSDTTVASYAWAKQTKNEMWTVKVNDISLGHTADTGSLGISGEHVLLDSGTTNIIFPENTEAKVKAAFKSFCPGLKGICDGTGASIWNNWIQLTEDELVAFPDLYVKVDGVYKTLRLTPAMYMTEYNGYYILNLDFLGNDIILGNGFMKNFRIGFDVDGKRIGFADLASCPGDNDLDEIRADPASFKVGAIAKPIGLQFEKPSAYQYAWLCGWNATSDIACNPATDATCKTSLATKPAYMPECPEDWNYAIGKDVEYQARWGRPLSAVSGQAGIGFDVSLVSAVPPFTIPFVFGQVKYYNSPIDSETYVTRIIVNSHTKFMHNVSEASTFADFEYNFHLKVTNFDVCEGLGCPWNDPKVDANWPEQFINDECVETERGYRLINKDGPLCCPYYTSRNDFNQCSDLVELLDDGIADNDYVTLQGEKYKIMLTGFHAAVGGHRGRGLVRGFAADFNQLTRVNIHAQLIDLCPDCPPNTRQVRNEDGSCQCECAQTCKLPLSAEPDCSCVARISHSHCSADCGPEDAAALGCDTQRGEVFTKIFSVGDFSDTAHEVCGCRCVQGCPAGYKQSATCQCVCDCDPNAPPPAGANPQHNQCNKWICNENGVGCKYVADHAAQCDKYNWPIGQPKDPQCWAPKCVDVGQTAECQGVPQNVNPGACPVPAGVSPHCYVHKCDGAGHCSTEFISSTGGQAPGSPHLGNCPVPAGMDARCYWPYCDSTGNCAGDVFSGQPYTAAGDWKDGTMGTRPGQPACTVEELTDAGNAKYGKFNPECFVARCDGGKCGGDAVNFGQPCNPIDGRGTGGYNEVFVGDAWPGITADCVYYECGSAPGERGHCIQRALPGARQTPCHNSDNDLCTLDFCDGLGMCKDHEWIQGHHPEGVCVTSTCNPRTGEWTFERNGEACCENGVLNFGEECEVGVNGADKLCCVDCYLQNKCDDGNVCTSDTCVDGHCVSTVDLSFSSKCPPLDASVADNRCKLVACSAETGNCEAMADPTKEGVECDADTDQCNHHVCRAGRCVLEADNVGQTCSLPTAADLTCKSLQCVARDGKGACEVVNDNSKSCNDNNACTSEACVDGACVPTPSVQCPAAADSCHAPGVCNPTTGACESAVLPDGTACPKPADANTADKDACVDYVCEAGQCVRSETGACICGNGKLDEGEECDWSIAAQKDCCSSDCTGCICGNGKLDEGEECDFNIPSQLECCNKECQGCKCGNGILDEGEACDPVLAEKNGECCNPDCTPCPVLARSSSIGVAVGAATAGLVVAFALAALIAVRASSAAAGAVGGAGPGAGAVTNAVNNPAFVPSNNDITSPIYQPMAN